MDELRPGHHVCCLYETEDEYRALLVPYIRQGLERHEKVLYIVDSHERSTLEGYLQNAGLDVDAFVDSGQLVILTPEETYTAGGDFEPDAMIARLEAATNIALQEGYAALRATGEMTWARENPLWEERLVEYEAKLNRFMPASSCMGLCQYDRHRFSPPTLLKVLDTHPTAIVGAQFYHNFYFMPPEDYLGDDVPAATLRQRLHNLEHARQTEARLREAIWEAEASSRMKSEFLANMSHEIRTPMAGVMGLIELMLHGELNDAERDLAGLAYHSAESLLGVLNDILDFSRMESGLLRLENDRFDLCDLAEDVGALLAPRAQSKGLDLVVRYSPGSPRWLKGDATRIRQVLLNLVGNAVKFTDTGQVLLDVAAELEPDRAVAGVTVRVADSGIGIPSEYMPHLFERFTQADASCTRRHGGTGLGLAICRKLVELMEGTIAAESPPGEGSVFTVSLRLAVAEAQGPTPRQVQPVYLQDVRLLIVDDNEVNRRVLHELITTWGMRNGSFSCAQDALEAMRKAAGEGDPYQVAILDYSLPDLDGLELGRRIRQDPTMCQAELILLTSMENRIQHDDLRGAGFAACLVKPTRQSQLMNAVAAAWSRYLAGMTNSLITDATPSRFRAVGPTTAATVTRRVLVVEDNAVNAQVITGFLERLNCRSEVAGTGAEALARLAGGTYDLVLMDCEMPDMDGYQATREIRGREGALRRTPIVALTAHVMPGTRESCLAAGMDDYLAKPVTRQQLVDSLERWCPR